MIQNTALIGAGAVGSFFIEGLQEILGDRLWVIASGERKERLERDGIVLNGVRLPLHVRTPEQAKGADLVILCVKYGALEEAMGMLATIADEHTIILCPMNGVDSEERIAAYLKAAHKSTEHILHSMMVIAAERQGNRIRYNEGVIPCVHYGRAKLQTEQTGTAEGEACIGETGLSQEDADLEAVRDLFTKAGLCAKYEENIITTIWNKFALNISTNIAQAIVGCSYGAYKTSPYMNELGQRLCDELLAVAEAKGIVCTFDNQRALRTVTTSDHARFSTLQDIMAGRHTEVDMFCGTIIRMGKECHVPTPFNEFAYLAIKALEEKNDGKIS